MTTTTISISDYSIKNYKRTSGREGHGYEVTLYRLGSRIGTVVDYGDGGCADFHIESEFRSIVQTELDTIARTIYPEFSSLSDLAEMAISYLVDCLQNDKDSKKGVVLKKRPDNNSDSVDYNPSFVAKGYTEAQIREQFPNAVIWNTASRSWVAI